MADRAVTDQELDDLERIASDPTAPLLVAVPARVVLELARAERTRRAIPVGIHLQRRFWMLMLQSRDTGGALRTVVQEAILEDRRRRPR